MQDTCSTHSKNKKNWKSDRRDTLTEYELASNLLVYEYEEDHTLNKQEIKDLYKHKLASSSADVYHTYLPIR